SFLFTVCDVGFCLEPDASPYPEAGEGRNRLTRAVLSEADLCIAVCRADPVGVKNFVAAFESLADLVDLDRVFVVVNRARSADARELRDLLRDRIGKSTVAFVPERVEEWRRAVAAGTSIYEGKPASEISRSLHPVVAALGGRVPRKGFLTRLGGRR
ncbi:MAG TPA: hypothetical protein VIG64_09665, partial [Actinomycetota bacterium]